MLRRVLSLAVLLALIGAALLAQTEAKTPSQPPAPAPDLRGIAHCSKEKPGTPVMELSWNVPPGGQEVALKDQRVDATVYRDGFNLGRFVSLLPVASERSFASMAGTARAEEMPKALNLRAVSVELPAAAAATRAVPAQPNRVTVRLEGLDPGIKYSLRLSHRTGDNWVSIATVSAQAPACPVDRPAR